MKKIPKALLWQLDIFFYLTIGLLVVAWITWRLIFLLSALAFLAAYIWVYTRLKCPHCGRMMQPWIAAQGRKEPTSCPNCGMQFEVG